MGVSRVFLGYLDVLFCCCCCFVVFFLFCFVFWVLSCSLFLFDGFGERVFARERYCAEAESKNAVGEWRYYHF